MNNSARHYESLDGCRGICACLVAFFHFRALFHVSVNSHIGKLPIITNAWLAVDFFFVLSGFVIAANYQDRLVSRTVRVRDFLILRLGRLYPLHLATLILMVGLVIFFHYGSFGAAHLELSANDATIPGFVANLFLIQGLHTLPQGTWNHPSWSISTEVATYLVFALSWHYLQRYTWILIVITILLAPPLLLILSGDLAVTFDWGFIRSMLGFSLGALAFNVTQWGPSARLLAKLSRLESSIAELFIGGITIAFVCFVGVTPLSIASPFLFTGVVMLFSQENGIITPLLRQSPMRALGQWSYSIYMLHYPLQSAMMYTAVWMGTHGWLSLFSTATNAQGETEAVLGRSPWVGDGVNVLMMLLLLILSAITYRRIEEPWRRRSRGWVRRFDSARSDRIRDALTDTPWHPAETGKASQ